MKTKHKITLVGLVIMVLSFTVFKTLQEDELIIGTWVSEGNTVDYRWVFNKDGTIERYSENKIYKTYTWSIGTTSPQCGQKVPTGKLFSYLKLVNIKDSSDTYCYEILSLNSEYLQIRWLERGGSALYERIQD